VEKIFYFSNLAKEEGKNYSKHRFFYERLLKVMEKDRIVGIMGPRGVGKTIILKQLLNSRKALYISMDTYDKADLFDSLISIRKNHGVSLFLIDEIHFYNDFSGFLKKIYDFSDIQIVFTTSMALSFIDLKKDLSRRVRVLEMNVFDFREYLWFSEDKNIDEIDLGSLSERPIPIEYMGYEPQFIAYLKGALFPFSIEVSDVLESLRNVKETIIFKDISKTSDLSYKELQRMEEIISFIAKSEIDGINYSSLSRNLNISKYKIMQYVSLLEKGFLLNVVLPEGTNIKKEPKIMLALPFRLLYSEYEFCIGALREEFSVMNMRLKGFRFYYLKSKRGEKRPDYLVKDGKSKIIIEIGGKNKGYSQFKGIDSKKYQKLVFSQNAKEGRIPLYIFGMIKQGKM
jgi:predicted AAA+ superfamily ATPase